MRIHSSKVVAAFCLIPIASLFVGCNGLDQNRQQLATVNGEGQVIAANRDLDNKISMAKTELQSRQQFYQGVSGTYEGHFSQNLPTPTHLNTRMILSPTVPNYSDDRVRTLDELTTDLKSLALNVQIVQWDDNTGAVWGCAFLNVQPSLTTGKIRLLASDCPNSFSLWLSDNGGGLAEPDPTKISTNSSSIARALLQGRMYSPKAIAVEMDPSHSTEILRFTVERSAQ